MRSYRINETDMNTDEKYLIQLSETIEQLRCRITEHGKHIGGHETRTRVILIDPLLRSLGWEPEDPALVVHEHPIGDLRVDYALFRRGKVIGILEAKALGSKLSDSDLAKYVEEIPGVPVIAFTNGNEWRFFRKSGKRKSRTRETVKVSSGASFKTGFLIYQKIGPDLVIEPNGPRPGTPLTELLELLNE